MTTLTRPVADTANDAVNVSVLQTQLAVAGVPADDGIALDNVTSLGGGAYTGGQMMIMFSSTLSGGQIATVDATIAAHVGAPVPSYALRAETRVVGSEVAIVSSGWADITESGVVLSPDLLGSLDDLVGIVNGESKADGAGAEIRIVEDPGPSQRVISASIALPNTGAAWGFIPLSVTNDSFDPGRHTYMLQGRLNGATSASIRFVSLALAEESG